MNHDNPLVELHKFGQSIWLDFIQKGMIHSGELESLIQEDGLLGVTSNPSIFEKTITGSHDYDKDITTASLEGKTAKEIYQDLTIHDIQSAADLLRSTYERTKGVDGFVSLEVSPHLAYDTKGTIEEARTLWKNVSRPNVLIKVPATVNGLPAIQQLISEGINVNVTLLFGIERYEKVAESYIAGLESRIAAGKSVRGIVSVASFFISRIDVAVDPLLPAKSPLRGQTAIASAKIAYKKYQNLFGSHRFQNLRNEGAKPQRLLWASTSTKNPKESDIKYVEALIGPDTINTLPMNTLNDYRDHGKPANRLANNIAKSTNTLERLSAMNINLKEVTQHLEAEGVSSFSSSFDKLMITLETKRNATLKDRSKSQKIVLTNCGDDIQTKIEQLQNQNICKRLWQKDASLWPSESAGPAMIKNSLGWLHIAEKMEETLDDIKSFVSEIRDAGFQHVVHMGMGGSSLASLVFARTFSAGKGLPLTVLDTTDPVTIQKIKNAVPLEKTLFIVASKSGTTAEPLAFKDYFYECIKSIKGPKAGENFIAITDPNTPLVQQAQNQNFRRIFLNAADIGGRYSALSYFGLVPAALMGVPIDEILQNSLQPDNSAALILGTALGEMALQKKDKITLLIDKSVEALGLWLEQLMAESTGKKGTGLIPIANEKLGPTSVYGDDRLFIHVTVKDSEDEPLANMVSSLKDSGLPVVTIEMSDKLDLGREFFQWEFATAIAGSILKINAFDQPNVQESKDNTDKLLSGNLSQLQQAQPNLSEGSLGFYSPIANATSASVLLSEFLKSAHAGDYIALMAFLPESDSLDEKLQTLRKRLRDKLKLATTLGYGPRFLHSTGQLHKGGPNTGLFIQLTANNSTDLPIPGRPYTFGTFKSAQAQGDLAALHKHGRRAMRIHLGNDIGKGLEELDSLLNLTLTQSGELK